METTVENKEYFSTIIDAMTDLIRVVDEEGRILMINAAMQEVAGSCLGKPVSYTHLWRKENGVSLFSH